METVINLLTEAVQEKLAATIVYNGGSKPGEPRTVFPVRIGKDGVTVTEFGVFFSKTFKFEKIASVVLENGKTANNTTATPAKAVIQNFETLGQYAEVLQPEYEKRGWNVLYDAEEQSFSVGRFFKNGKPRKTPAFSIAFYEFDYNIIGIDDETGEVITDDETSELVMFGVKRVKPWSVYCESRPVGRTFSSLHKAMVFLTGDIDAADPFSKSESRKN